ncbi:family 43 glycosylhydrolase [Actinosynnema mirum]|uniref:Alpha-N-arabinofuranosidase n=1 Tax=Actinosynnema mirum (strain ATCC 29888 / DSM 43827 / JCM 3225 / NBRC 14064 / NCIMB 13271 / NRRL B-12336 / IMRU 3971 / 101) TaxID=446462 RepID=C6WE63_ACTMD|nr:family 43 glycosylhydrolase [Actinosynnema mirum]ACU35806.1 Alpha-N-arabinofuranosidase [Actinosynnema mirum DSM 43827]
MSTLDRRSLLRAGGALAAASTLPALGATTASAQEPARTAAAQGVSAQAVPGQAAIDVTPALPTRSPLVEQRADPFVTPPTDGMYYLTGSVPEYDRIVIRGASTLDGLTTARERTIWRRPTSGKLGGYIWAPELHRIDGKWYVYFAAGDSDEPFRIRTYVLESANADPRADGWVLRGQVTTAWDTFTLDATTFEHRGKRYFLWAQSEPGIATNSNLYIAEMASPLALKSAPVRIAVPTLSWEIQGFKVNEGAAVLIRNGRVFVTYSASATDSRYCMGLLTADENANLLDARSWTKSQTPIFTTNTETGQYGPGHNSFTTVDGADVMVYHARDYRDITGDPLFDPNRHARVQRVHWNDDGTPSFGVPVGKGGPISRLSPLDAPTLFVRHYDYKLRVDGNVRTVADSQFRFVPGFFGAGTVALQSVNYPNRYARVVDGVTIRVDPYEDSDAYGRAASFVRVEGLADKTAVSLRPHDSRTGYLSHDSGRLVVAEPGSSDARKRATFKVG